MYISMDIDSNIRPRTNIIGFQGISKGNENVFWNSRRSFPKPQRYCTRAWAEREGPSLHFNRPGFFLSSGEIPPISLQ
jgi:hypothetical protein